MILPTESVGYIQAIASDCLCKRVYWDEIDDSFGAFKKEINQQAHEKSCIYLFRTEMYDYPIPFWVKTKRDVGNLGIS